jgi:hypothetical protein
MTNWVKIRQDDEFPSLRGVLLRPADRRATLAAYPHLVPGEAGMRRFVLCAVALALAATTQAAAGPKSARTCGIADPRGDARILLTDVPNLDIVEVCIATGRSELIVLLRRAGVTTPEPWAALGQSWEVATTLGGVDYRFWRRLDSTGTSRAGVQVGNTTPTFVFADDVAKATLRWIVKRSELPSAKKPGSCWQDLRATTGSGGSTVDTASGVLPGCSRVGRG